MKSYRPFTKQAILTQFSGLLGWHDCGFRPEVMSKTSCLIHQRTRSQRSNLAIFKREEIV